MCAKVLVAVFLILYVSSLLAEGGHFPSYGVYINSLKVEPDAVYVQVEGGLENLTSASGNTCTVRKSGHKYSVKVSLTGGGMIGGEAGGGASIVALLQAAQEAHLPVTKLWSYSPVGSYVEGTNQTVINVGSCSGLDANLPIINSITM